MTYNSKYSQIRAFRDREIHKVSASSNNLNLFHDEIINQTVSTAIGLAQQNLGPPPSPFCFFVMGSAGRREQGIWSDQDHGIIYKEGDANTSEYFLALGEEITEGLLQTGYKKCDGNVMASNPFWCKSLLDWKNQLNGWVIHSTWDSIRHLLTFIDGRAIYGDDQFIHQLKTTVYDSIHQEHSLVRILENTMHIKKSIGVLGQFLVETHGPFTGLLNIKESGLFPFVNAARLLTIHGKLMETSTSHRLQQVPDAILLPTEREKYGQQFTRLQNYRLTYGVHTNYEAGHYLNIEKLSKQQKKELKEILKDGILLFDYVKKLVKRDDLKWQ